MFKYTFFFSVTLSAPGGQDSPRQGGWSENFYASPNYELSSTTTTFLGGLANARAKLLADNVTLIGMRRQSVVPVGAASVATVNFPGAYPNGTDYPSVGLEVIFSGATGSGTSRHLLRGVPDDLCTSGAYTPVSGWVTRLKDWIYRMKNVGAQGYGVTPGQPLYEISMITDIGEGKGQITLTTPVAVTLGQKVTVLRSNDREARRKRGGQYVVDAASATGQFVIRRWPYGDTEGGMLRFTERSFFVYSGGEPGHIRTRKVGRPFGLLRGRQSAQL